MNHQVDPIWIEEQIQDEQLRLLNLDSGHYYINEQAEVFSLNFSEPRQIINNIKRTGERMIVLYTPGLCAYEVPSLMLRTFKPNDKTKDRIYPCFKDANPSNCNLQNLFWGNENDKNQWKKAVITKNRAESELIKQQAKSSMFDENIPIVEMRDLVPKTRQLETLIKMLIDSVKRFMANHVMSDETYHFLRMILLRMKPALCMDNIPLMNLLSVFNDIPDELAVSTLMFRFKERFYEHVSIES